MPRGAPGPPGGPRGCGRGPSPTSRILQPPAAPGEPRKPWNSPQKRGGDQTLPNSPQNFWFFSSVRGAAKGKVAPEKGTKMAQNWGGGRAKSLLSIIWPRPLLSWAGHPQIFWVFKNNFGAFFWCFHLFLNKLGVWPDHTHPSSSPLINISSPSQFLPTPTSGLDLSKMVALMGGGASGAGGVASPSLAPPTHFQPEAEEEAETGSGCCPLLADPMLPPTSDSD